MDKKQGGVAKRSRKYFLAANWKSTGQTAFVRDIIQNLFNSFEYDEKKIGKSGNKIEKILKGSEYKN